jgi:hypothetical protein
MHILRMPINIFMEVEMNRIILQSRKIMIVSVFLIPIFTFAVEYGISQTRDGNNGTERSNFQNRRLTEQQPLNVPGNPNFDRYNQQNKDLYNERGVNERRYNEGMSNQLKDAPLGKERRYDEGMSNQLEDVRVRSNGNDWDSRGNNNIDSDESDDSYNNNLMNGNNSLKN